jgi:E3 ubiquitin-protein ligase UBR1
MARSIHPCGEGFLRSPFPTRSEAIYLSAFALLTLRMFRRGRRQFLHPARWEEVRKTWLNHGIPTMVARKLEGTVDSGGWETL